MYFLVNRATKPGKVRHEEWNGKKYTVAPITLIVEGVLKGSKGPIKYPGKEIARHPTKWNGMPIVASVHPKVTTADGDIFISARQPAILQQMEIGRVFNAFAETRKDGKVSLKGEGWFEDEATIRVDERILNRINKGEMIEQSVGLDGDLVTANQGTKDTDGTAYVATVHNFRPDHVAILTDGVGACPIDRGCGVLANSQEAEEYFIVNPKGQWQPPPSGDAPNKVKSILAAAYSAYRDKYPSEDAETKAKGAKIAWAAVKRAGWYKAKDGKWKKRKKSKVANSVEGVDTNLEEMIPGDTMPKKSVWVRLAKTLKQAIGLTNQPSHTTIRNQLYEQIRSRFEPKRKMDPLTGNMSPVDYSKEVWIEEVFDKYVIFRQGSNCYKLGYKTDLRSDTVTLSNDSPTEVARTVQYKPVTNEAVETPAGDIDTNSNHITNEPEDASVSKDCPTNKEYTTNKEVSTVNEIESSTPIETPNTETSGDISMALSQTERQQIIVNLKGDCKCHATMPWKTLDDTKLTALSDDTLQAYEMVRKSQETTPVVNTTPAPTPSPVPVTTPTPPVAPPVMNRLTPEEQEAIAFANEERVRQKTLMVNRLVEHVKDDTQRATLVAIYEGMDRGKLAVLVNQLPATTTVSTSNSGVNPWALAGGAPVVNMVVTNQEGLMSPDHNPEYDKLWAKSR